MQLYAQIGGTAKARLKFDAPGSLADFSAEHPTEEFRILSARPTDDGLLGIVEAETADPAALIRSYDEAPEVSSYEVVHADEQTALIQYVISEPAPHRASRAAGNLTRYPLLVRDGWVITDLITSHDRLSQFRDGLEAAGIPYELVSITQSTDPADLLTSRQQRFMTEAIEHGYYDTPRGCSLTDLTAALEVSKSTASVVLHRAEEQIIKEVFAEPGEYPNTTQTRGRVCNTTWSEDGVVWIVRFVQELIKEAFVSDCLPDSPRSKEHVRANVNMTVGLLNR